MPADIAAAPVGEAMRFVMEQIRGNGSAPLEAFLARFTADYAAFIKERMATVAAEAGPFTVVAYRLPRANVCVAELQADDGRGWALGVGFVDGVIRFSPAYMFPRPPGLSYRRAAPTDADALAALELAAPIVTGDVETAYDKSRDYFEAERLMRSEAFVVERDGAIVGLYANVVHPIRIAGKDLQSVYEHRVRVHPAARGGGVMRLAALAGLETTIGRSRLDVGYSFVAADNDAVLRLRPAGDGRATGDRHAKRRCIRFRPTGNAGGCRPTGRVPE
ncbi:MAG TPA: GNAT family N-acetyltransferase [Caulobacteraceae bacterium]|nr:GNAT family N-acetyltransferase [Caulobacteraceae bacterium]